MERKRTAGIYTAGSGYDVDRMYKGQRIRRRGFKSYGAAEEWLIHQLEKVRIGTLSETQVIRTFEDAAARYLTDFENKPSLVTDIHNLRAVMPFIGTLRLDQIHDGTLRPFVLARKAQRFSTALTTASLTSPALLKSEYP